MIRLLSVGTLCVFFLAGCGDSRKPVVQEQSIEVTDSDSQPSATTPHGMPPHGMPQEPLGPVVQLEAGTMTGPLLAGTLTAPDTWVRHQQRSPMSLAKFDLPGSEGDAMPTQLTVTAVGGTVEQNIERWKGQFGGAPTEESIEELEVPGITMTLVELSGTHSDSHMMQQGSAVQSAGIQMKGAIFKASGAQFIVKCYGPEVTVKAHAEEYLAFLKSFKPATGGAHGMPSGGMGGMGGMMGGMGGMMGGMGGMMPPGGMPAGHGTPPAPEEPAAEEPATEQPAAEEPTPEEPTPEEPAPEEPEGEAAE